MRPSRCLITAAHQSPPACVTSSPPVMAETDKSSQPRARLSPKVGTGAPASWEQQRPGHDGLSHPWRRLSSFCLCHAPLTLTLRLASYGSALSVPVQVGAAVVIFVFFVLRASRQSRVPGFQGVCQRRQGARAESQPGDRHQGTPLCTRPKWHIVASYGWDQGSCQRSTIPHID